MKWCWLDNYFCLKGLTVIWPGICEKSETNKTLLKYQFGVFAMNYVFFQWTLPVFKNNWQTLAGTIRLLLSVGFWVHSLGSRFHCINASDPASFLTGVSVCHKHPTWEKIINIFSLERIRNKIVIAQQCISWWTNLTLVNFLWSSKSF